MNVTAQPMDDHKTLAAYKAAVLIWKTTPPILILLGTVGNFLSIYVLTRRSIRDSTTALYLIVLAVSDLVVLYSGLLRQWVIYLFDSDVRHVSPAGCKLNIWLVYSSLDFSAWILIAVTLERLIAAWLPHSARTVCTKRKALSFIIAIGVFILALNAHFLFGMVFNDVYDESGNKTDSVKCSEINNEYYEFFNKTWPWIDLCAYCLIPFAVIVVGNSLILFKVVKSQRRAKGAVGPSTTHRGAGRSSGKHSSMTAMLLTLNIVFLVTTSPVSIYNIGYTYWVQGADIYTIAQLDLWWAIVNMLMYTNNSLNFLLYCLSGTKFRREVVKMFCRVVNRSSASVVESRNRVTKSQCRSGLHGDAGSQTHSRSNLHIDNSHLYPGRLLDDVSRTLSECDVNNGEIGIRELELKSTSQQNVMSTSITNDAKTGERSTTEV